jgi:hypothetical protein
MVSSHGYVSDSEAPNGLDRGACLLGEPFRRELHIRREVLSFNECMR